MSNQLSAINSNICHIEAANEGGERWNPDMSDKQRAEYENLILLCHHHHQVTNDERIYTVSVLKEMKKKHEDEMAVRVSVEKPLSKRPSLLSDVINKLSSIDIDEVADTPVENTFSIEDKIEYNGIITNKPLMESYKIYQGKINSLYGEIERAGSNKKASILRAIKHFYLTSKGEILGDDQAHASVVQSADKLIDSVRRQLHEVVEDSSNNQLNATYEEVEFAVSIIVVDGFMRCKILEEPVIDNQ